MGNTNAQIIELNRTTRESFETDTASLTDPTKLPIMCVIEADPPEIGVKFKDLSYDYFPNQTDAIAALQASITTLEGVDAGLQTQINTLSSAVVEIDSTASVKAFGSMNAPLLGRFQPVSQDGSMGNHQLFVKMATDFTSRGIVAVWVSSSIVELTRLDETPPGFELAEDGGGMIVNLYRYLNSTLLGSISGLEPNANGLFTIKADGTDETIGYLLTTTDGMPTSEVFSPTAIAFEVGAFCVPKSTLGEETVPARGIGMMWEFELSNYVASTSLGGIDYLLLLGGQNLAGEGSNPSFSTDNDTSGSKRFITKITVTYLGVTDEGSGSGVFHNFRTEISVDSRGAAPFSTTPDPLILECAIDDADLPTFAYFDFVQTASQYSGPGTEHSQQYVRSIRHPAFVAS